MSSKIRYKIKTYERTPCFGLWAKTITGNDAVCTTFPGREVDRFVLICYCN